MQTNFDICFDKMYEKPREVSKEEFLTPQEVLELIADGAVFDVNEFDYIYYRRLPDGDWDETPIRTGDMLFQSCIAEVIPAILRIMAPITFPRYK